MNRCGLALITPCQIEVCRALVLGQSRKQIARARGISLIMVQKHIDQAKKLLDCQSDATLGAAFAMSGLVRLPVTVQVPANSRRF